MAPVNKASTKKETVKKKASDQDDAAGATGTMEGDVEASNVERVIGYLEKMTLLEVNDLVKQMEEKFGISAAMPMMAAAAPAAAQAAAPAEEQSEFDVVLTVAGEKKLHVIKEVRTITGLPLKEAKDLVEGAPKVVKEKASKGEATEIKTKLEAVGATVEIK